MANTLPRQKRWAILIGLDYYENGNCLQGSVRDVHKVEEYLTAGPGPLDIVTLTAKTPIEIRDSWPTQANVIKNLLRVCKSASPDDFVYIHYSGHGTRRSQSEPANQLGNLALALVENNPPGDSYLLGGLLANCLKRMVEKGLLVTLVLDCCFSGSVLRTGDVQGIAIRSVDYDPAIEAATPSDHQECFNSFDSGQPLRDSRLEQELKADPDGYTILAACGPHETAHELQVGSWERRGALSYFLMEALSSLRKRGVEITHESLYEHMRVMFHAHWPQQTPMRYGNQSLSFFGGRVTAPITSLVYANTMNKELWLDAGEAHGVHVGDRYQLYPYDRIEDAANQANVTTVKATVDVVHCLKSILVIETAIDGQEKRKSWYAKPITSLSKRQILVRLPDGVYDQVKGAILQEDQLYLQLRTSEDEAEACMFNVVLRGEDGCEILDGLKGTITNLPILPLYADGTDQPLVDTLQHLSKFKYAEGIENNIPDTDFEASFSLVSSVGGGEMSNSTVFEVEHGGTWRLVMENKGQKPLHYALFNFAPSWKILNLLSAAGNNNFCVLEANSRAVLPLRMEVPEFLQSQGVGRCEDVIKIFVTSRGTSFPSMILPELPRNGWHRGYSYDAGNGLSVLLKGLDIQKRGHGATDDKWATRNFIIRTTMKLPMPSTPVSVLGE